ncbi:pseudouridine synthase [Alkalimarinus coralli]|uniref:pseudouridine synthase n=1 Tax=Alkalimarinus coralli TaxID=2935863 RepID=UPI00202AFA2B|nr:16S rRNA pseudouridine(516) synthase [Alkalimarinus coralli]
MITERRSKRTRIDRFISAHLEINRRDVKLMLAQKRIAINGIAINDSQQVIDEFSHVTLDGQVLQANKPKYLMMNKPAGVVSATKDEQHRTVIDLLDKATGSDLHIVGRLDLNSSGLLLLTNDSRWSRKIMAPENKVEKRYRVTLEKPLSDAYISAFYEGMYFAYEDITTKPAKLEIVSDYVADVSLTEGRYHQIKRMFGRFRNPVLALHRLSIGPLLLDPRLAVGESRELQSEEVSLVG